MPGERVEWGERAQVRREAVVEPGAEYCAEHPRRGARRAAGTTDRGAEGEGGDGVYNRQRNREEGNHSTLHELWFVVAEVVTFLVPRVGAARRLGPSNSLATRR